jgi:hypothetical protein
MMIMGLDQGLVFVGVQIAGNAGVPPDQAGFFVGAVILIGLRAAGTKGEPPGGTPAENTGFAARSDEETTLQG